MSSAKSPEFRRRLAFRLTLWYGGILVLSMLVCLGAFYGLTVSSMRQRTDSDLTRLANMLREALVEKGIEEVQSRIDAEVALHGANDIFFRVLDRQGRQVRSSDLASWADVGVFPDSPASHPPGKPEFAYWTGAGHHASVRAMSDSLGGDLTLQLGVSAADDLRVIVELRRIFGLVFLATAVVAVLVGWWMARRALAGMHSVTYTAQRISQGASLDRRVPLTGRGDEVDELARTVNGMLDRIEALVAGMKEMNDHLAHELRSPVTRMRGQAEMTLLSRSTPADYQAVAALTVEQCDRLLALINTMLDISELEGRVGATSVDDVDLAHMVDDVCELFQPVAEDRRVALKVEVDCDGEAPDSTKENGCIVRGDQQRLQRALANLVDNAIKYSPEGGTVRIRISCGPEGVAIAVSNDGPGIADDEVAHIFERFYRGRNSRGLPGNGLGLSLARAIVRAHGGDVAVASSENAPTTFTVTLPRAEA